MHDHRIFKLAVLAGSIALAFASMSATAATAPAGLQLPGQGSVSGNGSISVGAINGGNQTIGVSGNEVINWSHGSQVNAGGVGGFNVGSGAVLTFKDTNGGKGSAILNIDSSGNASQIFGGLVADGTNVFVANQNGVIVGATARVSGSGNVSLIANTLKSGAASDFAGNPVNLAYDGKGGNVTVLKGATVGTSILVSGGNAVNVDMGAFSSGHVTLAAGLPSAKAGAAGKSNANAALNVDGQLNGALLTGFTSAGSASNAGVLDLGGVGGAEYLYPYHVAGLFTNKGTVALPADMGAMLNLGHAIAYDYPIAGDNTTIFTGDFTNEGSYLGGLQVYAGDLVNSGLITEPFHLLVDSGNLTNTGTIKDASTLTVHGNLKNSGALLVAGSSTIDGGNFNNAVTGTFTSYANVSVNGGGLFNAGTFDAGDVDVTGGNLVNSGNISIGGAVIRNGSIRNSGIMSAYTYVETTSDENAIQGADYSIINSGTISGQVIFSANSSHDTSGHNNSTGSFINTGILDLKSSQYYDPNLDISAFNNVYLGGSLLRNGQPLSLQNSFPGALLEAQNGRLTVATPLMVSKSSQENGSASFSGRQVDLLSDMNLYSAYVSAGDKMNRGYAVRIGKNAHIAAENLSVDGATSNDHPNVLLNGTLSAHRMTFGGRNPVSDVYSGATGGLVATGGGRIEFDFTGQIKKMPSLDGSNFRYNYLPITVDGKSVCLYLNPVAYKANVSNDPSAVNVLVNGNVRLAQTAIATPVKAGGSAAEGTANWQNTHLVVQSTGNILSSGNFYWPGSVYLGTIGNHSDGSAAPGTLGSGEITLGGNFSNVIPGSTKKGRGISFITKYPLQMGGYTVTTNANSGINFGSASLTQEYRAGRNSGQFYGGTVGAGNVVNYGTLQPSRFHTRRPVARR